METDVSAAFEIQSWDEGRFDEEADGRKVTRALVTRTYSGDIDGTSTTQWLMSYADDGSASFVGLERVVGSVAGREGSVVVQHAGTYRDGQAKGQLTVVDGSGTEQLERASGDGSFLADPAGSVSLHLTIDETAAAGAD